MKELVKSLELDNVEQYYSNIAANFINGPPKAAIELFADMPTVNRAEFFKSVTREGWVKPQYIAYIIDYVTGASDMAQPSNYYTSELAKVRPHATEYAPTIKVFANGNGQDTKNLSLNRESATALIQWLQANYIN